MEFLGYHLLMSLKNTKFPHKSVLLISKSKYVLETGRKYTSLFVSGYSWRMGLEIVSVFFLIFYSF